MISAYLQQSMAISLTTAENAFAISISDNSEDVLIEILLRLPLKSLSRFRCVSKHWLSLINGPYFSHRRFPNSNSDPPSALLLNRICRLGPELCPGEPPLVFAPINTTSTTGSSYPSTVVPQIPLSSLSFVNPSSPHIYICNSCSGLLVCCDSTTRRRMKSYFVVNPTTREFKKLPKPRLLNGTNLVYQVGMSLAYDPVASNSPDHVFKVVCVMSSHDALQQLRPEDTVYQILIYSSDTEEWKLSGSNFGLQRKRVVQFDWSVFCNGAIHWYSFSKHSLYFDVENESLGIMDMPENTVKIIYFGASRGRLHIVDNCCQHDQTDLRVYEMKTDYSGWVVKHEIQLGGVLAKLPQHARYENYFGIHSFVRGRDHHEEQDEFLVINIPNYLIRYNFKDGRSEEIFKLPYVANSPVIYNDFVRYGWFDVFPYFESLARV